MNLRKTRVLECMGVVLIILFMTSGISLASPQVTLTMQGEPVFAISIEELQTLSAVTMEVTSVNSSGRESVFSVTGTLLDDLLQQAGMRQTDLESIRLIAGDGYAMEVPGDVLQNRDIILGYLIDDEPLHEGTKPVRVVIPEERAMYWVKNLVEIEIVGLHEITNITSIQFIDSLPEVLGTKEYLHGGNKEQAVSLATLVADLVLTSHNVCFLASDGFNRNETMEVLQSGYLTVTGDNNPLFLGPEIARGMQVKDVLQLTIGHYSLISLVQSFNVLPIQTVSELQGVAVRDIVELAELTESSEYLLIATDGYTVEISAADLNTGIIYLDEDGLVRTFFPDLPRNTAIKGLYIIQTK